MKHSQLCHRAGASARFAAGLLACLLATAAAAALPTGALPATTHKVVLEKTGAAYRWKLLEAPLPKVGDRQVLMHVHAVALNRGDLEILEAGPGPGPDISGLLVASDGAGEIAAVGREVKGLHTGMRVTSTYIQNYLDGAPDADKLSHALGSSVDGVLAEYVVLDETSVVPMQAGMSFEEAATLPTAGVTGWMATMGQRQLGKSDTVLVQGTGGVSVFALQFAAAAGAHVIVTSSSDEKLARARKLGASEGINYRTTPDWSGKLMELTHRRGADVIVDVGGKDTLEQSAKSLAFRGTLSIVGGLSGYDGQIPAGRLLEKVARAQGVFVGSRADYLRMNAFIAAHRLHPVIDRVYPLADYQAALQQMKSGNFVGKIVLRL